MKESKEVNRISRRDFLKGSAAVSAVSMLAMSTGSLLSGCTPKSTGPVHVRFQPSWIPDVQNGGIYAAMSEGYYEEAGLEMEILPGGPGILGGAVLDSGDTEIGEMASSVDLVKIISQGSQIVTFATFFQRSPAGLMYVKTDLEGNAVNEFTDGPVSLVGKRVGIQGGVNLPWSVMCAEAGVDPENDFEVVNVGYDPSPLFDGTIDAYWCFLTNQPGLIRAQGYDVGVIDSYDWGYRVPGNFYAVKPDYLEDNFDIVKNWLSSTIKGWEYCNSNCQVMADDIASRLEADFGTKAEHQVIQCQDQIPYIESPLTDEKGLLYANLDDWENAIRILNDMGELETVPKVEDFVTLDVLKAVYG
ncbi:MAG: ABC transporter substrate-binding protein [Anaerolineales bacterium]|nr:ABC transporter substrate-binding protein [Anaerolineales bacterium]